MIDINNKIGVSCVQYSRCLEHNNDASIIFLKRICMAKRKTRKKETEVKISEEVKVNDVPAIDDIVVEEPVMTAPDDGFLAAGNDEEPEVKVTEKTKVKEPKADDGLVVEEKKKVIKKVHQHGGRFSV